MCVHMCIHTPDEARVGYMEWKNQNISKLRMCMRAQSCLTLCDPWTVARQAPLSMAFPTQEWVAISSSQGSFWPRDRTWVSCVAGGFFTCWALGEVPKLRTHATKRQLQSNEHVQNIMSYTIIFLLWCWGIHSRIKVRLQWTRVHVGKFSSVHEF